MYEYKVSMFTGLRGMKSRGLYRVIIVESDKLLTNEEVRLEALNQLGTYPRTHHCEIELVKQVNHDYKDDTKEFTGDLDRLMMSISIRKTEISDKYRNNNLGKPNLNDLDWCYEQLYYLKKHHED